METTIKQIYNGGQVIFQEKMKGNFLRLYLKYLSSKMVFSHILLV